MRGGVVVLAGNIWEEGGGKLWPSGGFVYEEGMARWCRVCMVLIENGKKRGSTEIVRPAAHLFRESVRTHARARARERDSLATSISTVAK